jgi:YidC/Oxa1 family membrane protein insertase
MPAPGSLAEKALEERRLKSGKEHKKFTIPGLTHNDDAEEVQDTPAIESKPESGQRQQPKRKNRGKPAGRADGRPGPAKGPGPAQKPGAKPVPAADNDT